MKKIFTIWRFVIQLGWAKSGTWGTTVKDTEFPYVRTTLVGIMLLNSDKKRAIEFILGPILVTIGWVNKNQ